MCIANAVFFFTNLIVILQADIRRRVTQNLEAIIEELYEPFAVFRNLGQFYSDKFSQLFSLISNCKKAYNRLKTG